MESENFNLAKVKWFKRKVKNAEAKVETEMCNADEAKVREKKSCGK